MDLRRLLPLLLFGVAPLIATGRPAALPERKVFQFGEYTIEASAGDERFVEALAVHLADFKLPPPPVPPPLPLSLDDLGRRRDYFLGRIAAWLGLTQPTGTMASTYDTTLNLWRKMALLAPSEVPRRFALWRRPELLARIDSGEKIPGFSKDPAGGLDFDFSFQRDFNPRGKGSASADPSAELAAAWRELVWPIKLGAVAERTPDDEAAAALAELQQFYGSWTRMFLVDTRRSEVFNVLHETVESGILWHYLTSKDRRWFCDGVANFTAYKVVEGELGAPAARGYYDLEAELKKSSSFAPRVDLAAWPAMEDMEHLKYPADLNAANHAFATKVIADLCARHGDSFLPRLFQEIGRTKREKATIKTVYRACRKLTGENLQDAVAGVGKAR